MSTEYGIVPLPILVGMYSVLLYVQSDERSLLSQQAPSQGFSEEVTHLQQDQHGILPVEEADTLHPGQEHHMKNEYAVKHPTSIHGDATVCLRQRLQGIAVSSSFRANMLENRSVLVKSQLRFLKELAISDQAAMPTSGYVGINVQLPGLIDH